MSRGIINRKGAVHVLRTRLESDLSEIDHWSGSFDLGDEAIAKFLEARIAVREAILLVGEAMELIPEEER